MKEYLDQLKEINEALAMVETKGDSAIIFTDCRRGLFNIIQNLSQNMQEEVENDTTNK